MRRLEFDGMFYRVTSRGNAREPNLLLIQIVFCLVIDSRIKDLTIYSYIPSREHIVKYIDVVLVVGFKALFFQIADQLFQGFNLEQVEHPLVQHEILAEL